VADLDPSRIAAAALAVADEQGEGGFSMRAVARVLGVTPMALYHHVKDKAALAALVVDAAIAERPLPPPTGDWREDLWIMARWMRESMRAHPGLAHIRRADNVWTGATLEMTERWPGLWRQSGLSPDRALVAATASSLAIVGMAQQEAIFRAIRRPEGAALAERPNARMMFDAPHDAEAAFELLVRALIDGLYWRLAAD
jgi:TetR/AcrR family transcriptional regulator, tetracycline repressor protein